MFRCIALVPLVKSFCSWPASFDFAIYARAYPSLQLDVTSYEFEDEKPAALQNFYEYYLGTLLYSALTENAAAELCARMTSMDNATRNAGEMLDGGMDGKQLCME